MKITLENTSQIVEVNGVEARVWVGTTESGISVQCLIARIAVSSTDDCTEFERELSERRPPVTNQAYPLRLIL